MFAYERATMMYKCWRRDDASDPETFIDAAAAILADYPTDVIVLVTDPRSGLAGKLKWPAQPSEVKDACEYFYAPRRQAAEWDKRSLEQLAERAALESLPPKTDTWYHEFKADMAARGMPVDAKKEFTVDMAAAERDRFKAKHNLTDAEWDAIPNSPAKDHWERIQANHRKWGP